MWDNSSIDCERRDGFSTGHFGGNVSGLDASECVDDYDTDTVLEMYHYTNGTYMELNGFLDEAIREYRDAISFNPHEGYYHYNLGVALLNNGQYNEAFKELSEALNLNPDDLEARCALADVHSELGRSLALEGRTEEAIAEFREAIAIDPCYPEYHVNLGKALLEMGQSPACPRGGAGRTVLAEAVAELRKALDLDPDCVDARLSLGVALAEKGPARAVDEGIVMLSAILQADPLNEEARHSLDYARGRKSTVLRHC
ncbi:MAG: photosystem I assembly protein Ycf3 [Methanocella sp. PtaU1.Bin125]|nr:MAG: photosystem I assembly protein Ycf3 [Methanocella sp. PtaU1.Bin125]